MPELAEYLPELRPPLEAQLIDLADEIAYDCADLDDGYSAHILTVAEAVNAVPALAAIFETVETQYPGASEREQFQEALRTLIDELVSGLIAGHGRRRRASPACGVAMTCGNMHRGSRRSRHRRGRRRMR